MLSVDMMEKTKVWQDVSLMISSDSNGKLLKD